MTDSHWITCLLLLPPFAAAVSIVFWSLKLGITPTPTSRKVRHAMEQLLPGDIEGNIYELGCGWGTLLLMLSHRYPDQQITGYERSTIPYLVAKALTFHKKNIKVLKQDFFGTPLKNPALVVCYLFPATMRRLDEYLYDQAFEKSLIISHTFRLPNWRCLHEVKADDLYRTPVYLYTTSDRSRLSRAHLKTLRVARITRN